MSHYVIFFYNSNAIFSYIILRFFLFFQKKNQKIFSSYFCHKIFLSYLLEPLLYFTTIPPPKPTKLASSPAV
jgi:hypothetical protein